MFQSRFKKIGVELDNSYFLLTDVTPAFLTTDNHAISILPESIKYYIIYTEKSLLSIYLRG